ncbi:MAG: nucleoside monophosphate kinase [Clostridia bacterium]|nr:nucleoside monophosphate kinase [Clostridia bacterium]
MRFQGLLVPDDVTVRIVEDRLQNDDAKKGYLLDGFPRNVAQAEALDKISKVDAVVNIDVPLDKLLRRITGRRVCVKCNESYHIDFLNGQTVCKCGGELIQRADDNEDTVKSRLDVYEKQTAPLIDYYAKQGKLITVDDDGDIDGVYNSIVKRLG